jgi:chromosome segregation ATPase
MSQTPSITSELPDLNIHFVQKYNEELLRTSGQEAVDPDEVKRLETSISTANIALQAKTQALKNAEAKIQAFEDESENVDEKYRAVAIERDRFRAQLESCTQQYESQIDTIESLQQDIQRLKVQPASPDTSAQDESVKELRIENQELRTKTQQQRNEIEALKADNKTTWDAVESFRKKDDEQTATIEELRSQLASQANSKSAGSSKTSASENRPSITGTKEELKARILKARDAISRVDKRYNAYGGLDVNKVPADLLGEVVELFERELEVKNERQAHVLRARNS